MKKSSFDTCALVSPLHKDTRALYSNMLHESPFSAQKKYFSVFEEFVITFNILMKNKATLYPISLEDFYEFDSILSSTSTDSISKNENSLYNDYFINDMKKVGYQEINSNRGFRMSFHNHMVCVRCPKSFTFESVSRRDIQYIKYSSNTCIQMIGFVIFAETSVVDFEKYTYFSFDKLNNMKTNFFHFFKENQEKKKYHISRKNFFRLCLSIKIK